MAIPLAALAQSHQNTMTLLNQPYQCTYIPIPPPEKKRTQRKKRSKLKNLHLSPSSNNSPPPLPSLTHRQRLQQLFCCSSLRRLLGPRPAAGTQPPGCRGAFELPGEVHHLLTIAEPQPSATRLKSQRLFLWEKRLCKRSLPAVWW